MAQITKSFTESSDTFITRNPADQFWLSFLGGADKLIVIGGSVQASMGSGSDTIDIRGGQASIFGDEGNDTFNVAASDVQLDGGIASDRFYLRGGSFLTISGGDGADRFDFLAMLDTISIQGGGGDDQFFGNGHSFTGAVYGGAGNDRFYGFEQGAGAISLFGGEGNDIYRLSPNSQTEFFENINEGIDAVQICIGQSYVLPNNIEKVSVQSFATIGSSATVTGNASDNSINAHDTTDTLSGLGGNDAIWAKAGDDDVSGGEGNDYLDGGAGEDVLRGDAGNDYLVGGDWNDELSGGDGADILVGGAGTDSLTGGAGADKFVFRSPSDSADVDHDTIHDFQAGIDKIDLSAMDANLALAGDQSFTFVGAPTGAAGEAWVHHFSEGLYVVAIDVDGDATTADMYFWVTSNGPISAADIIL